MGHQLACREVRRQHAELGEDLDRAGAGDAADRGQVEKIPAQLRVLPDQVDGLLFEACDAAVEMTEIDLDVVAHEIAQLMTVAGGVEAVFLLAPGLDQGGHAAGDGPELESLGGWRLPGLEGHAPDELEQDLGIEGVGLRALQEGFGKVAGGPWIDHHDLDAGGAVQSHGQIEAVDAAGLESHARVPTLLAEAPDELTVPGGVIGELETLAAAAGRLDHDGEGAGADVDAGELDEWFHRGLLSAILAFRSPDPAPSPTQLVDAGSRASETPRLGRRGRGADLTHRLGGLRRTNGLPRKAAVILSPRQSRRGAPSAATR